MSQDLPLELWKIMEFSENTHKREKECDTRLSAPERPVV